jgi:hypothetical protein
MMTAGLAAGERRPFPSRVERLFNPALAVFPDARSCSRLH